jgi:ribonuclease HI
MSKWISGEYIPKKEIGKMFVSFFGTKVAEKLQVVFEKVEAHSNNKYNNLADTLAGEALLYKNIAAEDANKGDTLLYSEYTGI